MKIKKNVHITPMWSWEERMNARRKSFWWVCALVLLEGKSFILMRKMEKDGPTTLSKRWSLVGWILVLEVFLPEILKGKTTSWVPLKQNSFLSYITLFLFSFLRLEFKLTRYYISITHIPHQGQLSRYFSSQI